MKRVQDVRESAAYLTVMTRYLTKLYQVKHILHLSLSFPFYPQPHLASRNRLVYVFIHLLKFDCTVIKHVNISHKEGLTSLLDDGLNIRVNTN